VDTNLGSGDDEKSRPQVRVMVQFSPKFHKAEPSGTVNEKVGPPKSVFNKDICYEKYDVEEVIGAGQSIVKKAVNKCTKKEVAIKFLTKKVKGKKIPKRNLKIEIDLLRSLNHPNIVQLYESFENADTIYIVMELVLGSDLHSILATLGTLRLTLAGAILNQLISAIIYLHSRGICYQDIKPENIVINYSVGQVKLVDFGSARDFRNLRNSRKLRDPPGVTGTLEYMAPEVLQCMKGAPRQCSLGVDVWGVGVVAYMMLAGYHPFDYKTKANSNIIARIISGKFHFPLQIWDPLPPFCKEFIRKCLNLDPKLRPTSAELLKQNPWVMDSVKLEFLAEEMELLEKERNSRHNSPDAGRTLAELFGNNPSTRS